MAEITDKRILKLFGPYFPKSMYEEAKDFVRFYEKWGFYLPDRHKRVRKWIIEHYNKEAEEFTKERQCKL